MNLGEIYNYIFALVDKDLEGESFTPDQFTPALIDVNLDLFNEEIRKLQELARVQKDKKIYEIIFQSSPLIAFLKSITTYSPGGKLYYPSDYEEYVDTVVLHDDISSITLLMWGPCPIQWN